MCTCARVLYRIDLHGWAVCQLRGVARAWDDESIGRRAWRASPLVEVRRAVRWVGGERAGPGEKEKEKRGSRRKKRPGREVRRCREWQGPIEIFGISRSECRSV